jgi:hypothetical protein
MTTWLCKLVHQTGHQLLPSLLFTKDGHVKSDDEFRHLVTTNTFQTFLTRANGAQTLEKWTKTENRQASDDMKWFVENFGFEPKTVQEMRLFLLSQHEYNLHLFISSHCEVWITCGEMVSILRQELS